MLGDNQTPTFYVTPECASNDWEMCHELMSLVDMSLLEWEDFILNQWLGRNELDRWAANVGVESVPRQNGKTLGTAGPRAAYGMAVLGEEVIYTSQLQKTSTETFRWFEDVFTHPKIKPHVEIIRAAIGREEIVLKNGARIKFLARTRNGGRGQHGDLLIFDEALELTADAQASFLPAIAASANPQTLYLSSPPEGDAVVGDVLRGLRDKALGKTSKRLAYAEWATATCTPDVISDVRVWERTNPSYGVLISEETVRGEFEQMPPRKFAIERLGYWPPSVNTDKAINQDAWACTRVTPSDELDDEIVTVNAQVPAEYEKMALGVKFMIDGLVCVAIAVEQKERKHKRQHIELVHVDNRLINGTTWLADWIAARKDKIAYVAIDGKTGGGELKEKLDKLMPRKASGLMGSAQVVTACSMLKSGLAEGAITHYGNDTLDTSAKEATKRRVGYDGEGFGGDSCAIEAAANAIYALNTTKRNPLKKSKMGG